MTALAMVVAAALTSAGVTGRLSRSVRLWGASASCSYSTLKALDRDARHSVHRIENRDGMRGTNGSLSARDIRARSRRTSDQRQEHRPNPGAAPAQAILRPSADAAALRRSIGRWPPAPSASACRQTPPRCRCRDFAGIAAAGTVAGAPHRAAARRSPGQSRARNRRGARDARSRPTAARISARPAQTAPTRSRGRSPRAPRASASGRCRGRTDARRSAATSARSAVRNCGSQAAARTRPDCPRRRHGRSPPAGRVHHCIRISPGKGWVTWSRMREISTLKA